MAIIIDLHKQRYAIDRESIACTLRLLLKEPHGRDDISRVVKEATRSRDQAKAARENLRRWCHTYEIDLDRLIWQVTTQ